MRSTGPAFRRHIAAALLITVAAGIPAGELQHAAIATQIDTLNPAVLDLVFAPDGKSVYETGHGKVIRQWSLENNTLLRSFVGHTETVYSLALSPDGTRLASGEAHETMRIWNTATGEERLKIKGQWRVVDTLQFTSDGKRLIVGTLNNTLDIYDPASGQLLQSLPTRHGGDSAAPFALSPDESRIATGGEDGKISVWDLKTSTQIFRTEQLGKGSINALRYIDGGKRIAVLDSHPTLRELDANTGAVEALSEYQSAGGNPVILSNDGRFAATSNGVLLIDVAERKALFNFNLIHPESRALAFSPDSKLFALTQGKSIMIWNVSKLSP